MSKLRNFLAGTLIQIGFLVLVPFCILGFPPVYGVMIWKA